jgi:hypothetical protein
MNGISDSGTTLPVRFRFSTMVVICLDVIACSLSKESKEEPEKKGPFLDYEPVHDSIGVTHWLPPRKGRNRND